MNKILNLIFPPTCCGCGKSGSYLCFECKKDLTPHPEICPACHTPSKDFKTCASCMLEGNTFLDGLLIGFAYARFLKKLILKLKFYHKSDVADFLAERAVLTVLLNSYLSLEKEKNQMIITFVPSHRYRKYFQKGYNQSELLAKSLAQKLNLPLQKVFSKRKATRSQVKLNKAERHANLRNVFQLQEKEIPQETTLLIVDDVTTTGATLNELAKTAKQQRPDLKVWGLVLARNMG